MPPITCSANPNLSRILQQIATSHPIPSCCLINDLVPYSKKHGIVTIIMLSLLSYRFTSETLPNPGTNPRSNHPYATRATYEHFQDQAFPPLICCFSSPFRPFSRFSPLNPSHSSAPVDQDLACPTFPF